MARTVRDTSLETRAARACLMVRHKPYYRLIYQGCHLGYRKGPRGGSWSARFFVGGGGDRAAALYTIVQTAKLNGVNPEAYLRDTLRKIAEGHTISRIEELMPWASRKVSARTLLQGLKLAWSDII